MSPISRRIPPARHFRHINKVSYLILSTISASSGGVIAYNGDSARGWNDPPTFAFSNNKTGNRPKLDLRKRVSHQQALHGVQAPSPSPHTTVAANKDDVINGELNFRVNNK